MTDAAPRDRWSDALDIVEQVPRNPARYGQHLDVRLIGPSCSITLLSIDDFKELVRRARLAPQDGEDSR